MIKFSENGTESKQTSPFTEGLINDAIKYAADIDPDKIKDEWEKINNDGDDGKVFRKAKMVNDEGISKGADAIEKLDKWSSAKFKVDNRSIIARARNSILQFPIYVTQTMRANEAQIIAKLFERVYTTLVQTVIAQNPVLDEDSANNLVFLKQFHSNLKESGDLFINEYYEPIDEIDSMMSESLFYSESIVPGCSVEFRWVPTTDNDIISENARLINEPLSGLTYLKEDKETTVAQKDTYSQTVVTENDLKEIARDKAGLTEQEKKLINMTEADIKKEVTDSILSDDTFDVPVGGKRREEAISLRQKQMIDAEVEKRMDQKREAEDKLQEALDKLKDDIKKGKIPNYEYDGARYHRKYKRTEKDSTTKNGPNKAPDVLRAVDAPKMLRDADIKKINGMLPYTMEVTFRVRPNNGGVNYEVRYVIGVKSVMHLIRTQDLADDLRDLVTGNIKSLQKVRYKTGEISFMDYMFNLSGIKADAAKRINYNKRWINTLKRLGEYKKTNGSLLKAPIKAITGGDVPIPNGTLVLAQTDVTTLTNQTGIDLSSVSNAKRLAKTLFLIGIVIVDSSAGTMRVLFPDSDTDWDVQSLSTIDAEVSKTDNSQLMRELNRMVNH